MADSSNTPALPSSILIVGGGVFDLSTALALTRRHTGKITLIDSSPIPNPHGSSVDSSRIIRADYANDAYSRLADDALRYWRTTEWGQEGRYTQNGLVLVSGDRDKGAGVYVRESYRNVKALNEKAVEELPSRRDVERVVSGYGIGDHVAGGYVNWDSGWGDAEEGVRYAKKLLDETGRVDFRIGEVKRLLKQKKDSTTNNNNDHEKQKVTGVELSDSSTITADLVILAAGAWTGKLIDLRGRAEATGQVLSYIRLSDEEQARLANMPTLLNFSSGMFIIPPRNNLLKVARHAYGYRNPTQVPDPSGKNGAMIEVSLPENDAQVPLEGSAACRDELRFVIPAFADRPFVKTRICWYTDTPKGDYIISHHPEYDGLFLATGGSGHGYKFLPVIGDKILDAVQGKLDPDLQKLWAWPEKPLLEAGEDGKKRPAVVWTEDGSRSGPKGLILSEELKKTVPLSRL